MRHSRSAFGSRGAFQELGGKLIRQAKPNPADFAGERFGDLLPEFCELAFIKADEHNLMESRPETLSHVFDFILQRGGH